MQKLPKLVINIKENDLPCNKVLFVHIDNFVTYDGYLYVLKNCTYTKSNNVNGISFTKSVKGTWTSYDKIHYPVINFNGILVLLLDNTLDKHKTELNSIYQYTREDFNKENNFLPISFYSPEDIEFISLLDNEGLKQLENYFVAKSDFSNAIKIRDIIAENTFTGKESDRYTKARGKSILHTIPLVTK